MSTWFKDIHLKEDGVSLQPLKTGHKQGLLKAASDGELWELWYTSVPSQKTVDSFINTALEEQKNEKSIPFVVVDDQTNTVIGSTRFMNIEAANKRLEIGHTWYAKSHQKTGVNTKCKLMLLTYAFEHLDCIAVEFRTNWFNFNSRNAILKLGAKQDGVLRNHRIDHNGLLRDTVVFSILKQEWPGVKKHLEFRLTQNSSRK
ncbi:MAG: N-acetyltransferase [Allomuricauda sp.]|nr:MAG: N-acetyltransferase [Allomuricauda sp.]